MPTAAMYPYNGYKITVRTPAADGLPVAVFDPRQKREPAIYRTTSLDLAMRWVDAYREGQQWAVEARQ